MKKTKCIQLVLITAALAGCERPFYQQGPPCDPGDEPDSSQSCPMAEPPYPPGYSFWYSGFQPVDFWFGPRAYNFFRFPIRVIRAGFGHDGAHGHGGHGHGGHGGHGHSGGHGGHS